MKKLLKGLKVNDFHNRSYKEPLPEVAPISKDDFVLMNPFLNGKRRIYHESYIRDWMNMILKNVISRDDIPSILYVLLIYHTHYSMDKLLIRFLKKCWNFNADDSTNL